MTRFLAAVAVLLALAGGTASAAVTVAPGWPRAAPSGVVLPGPQGGVVVVSEGAYAATVRAYSPDGRRRWAQSSRYGCGNCDFGPQPAALQPDGTYGPVGPEGDDYWAVDRRGRRVAGCAGVVQPDAACLVAVPDAFPAPLHPGITASIGGARVWRVENPRWSWFPEDNVPPMAVADGTGRVYTVFLGAADAITREYTNVFAAFDPATRTIAWTNEDAFQVLAGLPSGVLAEAGNRVVAYAADGTPRWTAFALAGTRATPMNTMVDNVRGRVYLSRAGSDGVNVFALDLATGAELWRTAPSDRARLLSVGRGGRVYVAVDATARQGIRALRFRDGTTAWQRRTRLPVRGALQLPDGRVAVSAGNQYAPTGSDRLTVLDPRPR